MWECPQCHVHLADAAGVAVVETVCPECRFKYQVLTGTLAEKTSRVKRIMRRRRPGHSGSHERSYELRIALPGGHIEHVRFHLEGRGDRIAVRPGDLVSVVHTMRNDRREDPLTLENLDTGEQFELGAPGDMASERAFVPSIVVMAATGIFAIGLGIPLFLALLISVVPSAIVFTLWAQRALPLHEIPTPGQGRVAR